MSFDLVMPCPKRPDLDCVAGAVAYAEYCRVAGSSSAAPWLCGVPDGAARFYIDLFPEVLWATEDEARNAKGYALVDFSTAAPLPIFIDLGKVVEVIDHRFLHDPSSEFPNAKVQLEAVGAAATLIAERFIRSGITPSCAAAAMLHGAIHSNTLNFASPLTTDRDRFSYTWLEHQIDNPAVLIDRYQQVHREEILSSLSQTLLDDTKTYDIDGHYVAFTQIELAGGLDLWHQRKDEIMSALQMFKEAVLLNIVDVSAEVSLTYTADPRLAEKVGSLPGASLDASGAFLFKPPLLRKQLCLALSSGS